MLLLLLLLHYAKPHPIESRPSIFADF